MTGGRTVSASTTGGPGGGTSIGRGIGDGSAPFGAIGCGATGGATCAIAIWAVRTRVPRKVATRSMVPSMSFKANAASTVRFRACGDVLLTTCRSRRVH